MYTMKKCDQRNKSRINKMKQDKEESINISDNVNLKRLYMQVNMTQMTVFKI